jgi:hypothetical protein
MTKKQSKKIIRLLCMQIDAHVTGNTKHSDKILNHVEIFLTITNIMASTQNVIELMQFSNPKSRNYETHRIKNHSKVTRETWME